MKTKTDLLNKYASLSLEEQRVLQISALLFHTELKTDFTHCILQSNVRTVDHKKLYSKELNLMLETLRGQGFIDSRHNCAPQILHSMAERALDPRNRNTVCAFQSIRALIPILSGH